MKRLPTLLTVFIVMHRSIDHNSRETRNEKRILSLSPPLMIERLTVSCARSGLVPSPYLYLQPPPCSTQASPHSLLHSCFLSSDTISNLQYSTFNLLDNYTNQLSILICYDPSIFNRNHHYSFQSYSPAEKKRLTKNGIEKI
jgi:hypothetical protein